MEQTSSQLGRDWKTILCRAVIAGLFILAAGAKANDPAAVSDAVRYLLPSAPGVSIAPMVGGIVAWEVFLAAGVVVSPRSRVLLGLIAGTLLVFSGVLMWLAFGSRPVRCGCLGIGSQLGPTADAMLGLLRNTAVMVLTGHLAGAPRGPCQVEPSPGPESARAFTLVESIVVVVVIAVIIALLLPALATSRVGAHDARSLAALRQKTAALTAYAADHDDFFPFFAAPGEPHGDLWIKGVRVSSRAGVFDDQATLWLNVLVPQYLDTSDDDPFWAGRDRRLQSGGTKHDRPELVPSASVLTYSVFAERRYWDGVTTPDELRFIQGARWSAMMHPALKGLVWDRARTYPGRANPRPRSIMAVAWGDGAAAMLHDADTDPRLSVSAPSISYVGPVMSTRDGLAGRDRLR